jgi:hypothetical protein
MWAVSLLGSDLTTRPAWLVLLVSCRRYRPTVLLSFSPLGSDGARPDSPACDELGPGVGHRGGRPSPAPPLP